MSINIWVDKEDVVYIYNGILCTHKREWNVAICNNMPLCLCPGTPVMQMFIISICPRAFVNYHCCSDFHYLSFRLCMCSSASSNLQFIPSSILFQLLYSLALFLCQFYIDWFFFICWNSYCVLPFFFWVWCVTLWLLLWTIWASPVAQTLKDLPANGGDTGDVGFIPELGRSLGEGNGNSLQYSCLENSMDWGVWQVTVPGVTRSQTWLSN